MVRRRRDQPDAWGRVPGLGDPRVHLVPGQLAALPWLGPCAILICMSSALTRYSLVTPNRPLATCLIADRRRSPLGSGSIPAGVLAALAGVGPAAKPVHRDSQGLVRFGRDRPVRHRPGGEPRHDGSDRLDLVERHGGRDRESPARRRGSASRPRSVISRADWSSISLRVLPKISYRPAAGRVLQPEHRLRAEQVRLARPGARWYSPPESSRRTARARPVAPGRPPPAASRSRPRAVRSRRRRAVDEVPAKQVVDHLSAEADCLEDLRPGVGGDGRHAHLGHDLHQALAERLDQVGFRLAAADAREQPASGPGPAPSRSPGTGRPPPRRSRSAARRGGSPARRPPRRSGRPWSGSGPGSGGGAPRRSAAATGSAPAGDRPVPHLATPVGQHDDAWLRRSIAALTSARISASRCRSPAPPPAGR